MSQESNSRSESSESSPQTPFFQEHFVREVDLTDLTMFGPPVSALFRSGTVRRANSTPIKKDDRASNDNDESRNKFRNKSLSSPEQSESNKKVRKSLETHLRRSLESIHESKTKKSFSSTFTLTSTSRDCSSSLESFSSDQTDYATRNSTAPPEDPSVQSPRSSYLTWIESVHNEYFGSSGSRIEVADLDNKVGEWNNFWLNYNSARTRYLSSTSYVSTEKYKAISDNSDDKSTFNIQSEVEKKSNQVSLTVDEIQEALKCSRRITQIFQDALSRNDNDYEESVVENSLFSNPFSRQNSSVREDSRIFTKEDFENIIRERSSSYVVNPQDLIRPKEVIKPTQQSSSTSCINAIMNSGVGDILKKMVNKKRDNTASETPSSLARRSFSERNTK